MATIIVISNMDTGEYFFSTNHCQEHGMGESFVPCTHYGRNKSTIKGVFYTGKVWGEDSSPIWEEIPNPQPNFQA